VEAASLELLEAFLAQFEERRVAVPEGWKRRLEQLATETEVSRRFATIIFVDMVGYTRLSQQLPEDQLDDLRLWFNRMVSEQIHRYGGFLIQYLGDAAFAAFGAPWAFERDAEAAIRCLLSIRDGVRELGSFRGHPVQVRAGAASGIITVKVVEEGGRKRPDLIGSVVNLAARLQGEGDPFDVVVPAPLAKLIEPAFEVVQGRTYVPKNYDQEVTIFRVLEPRPQALPRRRQVDAFVGRGQESAALTQAIGQWRAGGFASVAVAGEPGIGKTTLLRRVLEGEDLWADCLLTEADPYHRQGVLLPFLSLLSTLRSRRGSLPWTQVQEPLRPLLSLLEPTAGARQRLPPQWRQLVVVALAELLAAASEAQPLVLLFEDAHWYDDLSRTAINALLRRRPPGLLLLLTDRQEAGHAVPIDPCTVNLRLGPLDPPQAMELLRALTGTESLHPLVEQRLLDDADGRPLYLTEAAGWMEGAGNLRAEELTRSLLGTSPLGERPDVLQLLQARLDRFDAQQRLVLQCGAVLGRRFRQEVLAAYQAVRERLLEHLALLKGGHLLRDVELSGDAGFEFTPGIVREAAYGMLTAKQSRALHREFAGLIEQRFPNRIEQLAPELSLHWLKARQFDQASRHVRRGCLQAMRHGLAEQAYRLATEGLALSELSDAAAPPEEEGLAEGEVPDKVVPPTPAQVATLHEQAGRAARMLGDLPTAINHFQVWEASSTKLGNPRWQAGARYQQALTLFEMGDLVQCEEMLSSVGTGSARPDLLTWQCDDLQAKCHLRAGLYEKAAEEFSAVARRAEPAEPGLAGDAWSSLSICLQRLNRWEEALGALDRCELAYRRLGSPYGLCIVHNNRGIIHEKLGNDAAAIQCYASGRAEARGCGYLHLIAALACNESNLHYLNGRYQDALATAAESIRFAKMIGHGNSEVLARINLGLAWEGLGAWEESWRELTRAREMAASLRDNDALGEAVLELAWLALRQGLRGMEITNILEQLPANLPTDNLARARVIHLAATLPPGSEGLEIPDGMSRAARVRCLQVLELCGPTKAG